MKQKLLIKTTSIKSFLALFDKEEAIKELQLGDTWHPSSGFIDENILENKNKIQDILEFTYDFKGLVCFEGVIGNLKVKYKALEEEYEQYEIIGNDEKIIEIENKLIELNSYKPKSFKYSIIKL